MKRVILLALTVILSACFVHAEGDTPNVGQKFPKVKLSYVKDAVQGTGKPMIVEFWATWCVPCKKTIPMLNELYAKYKNQGLVVVGITDEDKPTINAFRKQVPMDFSIATDPEAKLSQRLGIEGVPHALLVDKSGRIVWEGHPLDLPEDRVVALLK